MLMSEYEVVYLCFLTGLLCHLLCQFFKKRYQMAISYDNCLLTLKPYKACKIKENQHFRLLKKPLQRTQWIPSYMLPWIPFLLKYKLAQGLHSPDIWICITADKYIMNPSFFQPANQPPCPHNSSTVTHLISSNCLSYLSLVRKVSQPARQAAASCKASIVLKDLYPARILAAFSATFWSISFTYISISAIKE